MKRLFLLTLLFPFSIIAQTPTPTAIAKAAVMLNSANEVVNPVLTFGLWNTVTGLLGGSIADQQVAFGNGTAIAGSDDFKWDNSSQALSLLGSSFSIADQGTVRLPNNFTIQARNVANDGNYTVIDKTTRSGHDNLVIGDQGNTHAYIEFAGLGDTMTIKAEPDGDIQLNAFGGTVNFTTDPSIGNSTNANGDLEVQNSGWFAIGAQTRANLIAAHGSSPFEGVTYVDSTDHHVYECNGGDCSINGAGWKQLDNNPTPTPTPTSTPTSTPTPTATATPTPTPTPIFLSGTTGSIGGAIIGIGCDTGTATVTGATTSMVAVAEANTYPGDGIFWKARVTNTNEVTVYVCSDVTITPTSSTYKVRVIP